MSGSEMASRDQPAPKELLLILEQKSAPPRVYGGGRQDWLQRASPPCLTPRFQHGQQGANKA
jgi:hypothetical protein